jgi:hypothetical protein
MVTYFLKKAVYCGIFVFVVDCFDLKSNETTHQSTIKKKKKSMGEVIDQLIKQIKSMHFPKENIIQFIERNKENKDLKKKFSAVKNFKSNLEPFKTRLRPLIAKIYNIFPSIGADIEKIQRHPLYVALKPRIENDPLYSMIEEVIQYKDRDKKIKAKVSEEQISRLMLILGLDQVQHFLQKGLGTLSHILK